MSDKSPREKNWKHLYMRSNKLARSRQLGIDYPRTTEAQLLQDPEAGVRLPSQTNVPFVCSRNQWRSPTAEQVWRRHPALSVRSAGTSPNARRPVSVAYALSQEQPDQDTVTFAHRSGVITTITWNWAGD